MLPRIHLVLAVILFSLAILKTTSSSAQCTVQAVSSPASCSGQSDGSISLQVTGTPPYKFEWSNGANTQNITSLTAGNYRVKVTDAKGAKQELSITVENLSSLKIDHKTNPPSMGSGADGLIEVSVTGGIQPYSFSLSNYSNLKNIHRTTQANNIFSGLSNGKYIIDITDAKGCMATLSIHLK